VPLGFAATTLVDNVEAGLLLEVGGAIVGIALVVTTALLLRISTF